MTVLYGPSDVSYMMGGSVLLVDAPGVTLTAGIPMRLSHAGSYLADGTGNPINCGLRTYVDGVYQAAYDRIVFVPDSGPTVQNWDLQGTAGTHNYRFYIWTADNDYGAGFYQLKLEHDPSDSGTGGCIYGTEKKYPESGIVELAPAIPGILLPDPARRWAIPIAIASLLAPVVLDVLCSGPPFPDVDLEQGDFLKINPQTFTTVASDKIRAKLQRTAWFEFCQCQMGPGGVRPDVTYPVTNWNQPTWYVSNVTNNISNYDLGPTLNWYFNLAGGQTINNYNTMVAAQTSGSDCAPQFERGLVHDELVGEGVIEVSDILGMEVEVTERPGSGLVLSGQPAYLWDMGWQSFLEGNSLLDEKRITRSAHIWLPCTARLATNWSFTLREGVTIRATELVKPSEIVLA